MFLRTSIPVDRNHMPCAINTLQKQFFILLVVQQLHNCFSIPSIIIVDKPVRVSGVSQVTSNSVTHASIENVLRRVISKVQSRNTGSTFMV